MKASIVLIPGMMCTKDVFSHQINYLNDYFNVAVVEFNQYDNIESGKYKTNSDIGVPATKVFYDEVKKYSYMWRGGGQFSTEKYKLKDKIDN